MYNKESFKGLINIIKSYEEVKLWIPPDNNEDKFHIIGMNEYELPNISFRIEDNKFILNNIFLLNEGKGIGTKVFQWIIDFCKKSNLSRFEVRIVDYENTKMRSLGKKFRMDEVENIDKLNLVLRIND